MKAFIITILFSVFCTSIKAQKDTSLYNPKKEIAYDGKRYRVYNNWLSVGAGVGYNTKWKPKDERNASADYSFHIREQYFRLGAFMSGSNLSSINNYNLHLTIGLRKETEKYNLSAFIGPSASYFRRPLSDSVNYDLNKVYNEFGVYACIETVYKIKYDVGLGTQLFCDYNQVQMVYGIRLIAYFSGAYRGIKYGYHAKPKK